MKPEPTSGTLIFLFTDVEGSTRLWERLPQAMKAALERHDRILQAAVAGSNGQVVKTTGDGMMATFASAAAAVSACLTVQRDLAAEPWGATGALRVRMGLHAGEAATRSSDYFGPAVNRTARIMAVGHGGQVLLSSAAAALVTDQLPDGAGLRDLGVHRLKDLGRAERLFQLVHPDLADGFPPLATLDRRPNNLPTQTSTFVGRDAELEEIGRRLEHEAVRLLTLTGPGGTGKTRLALRAAADEIDRFEDGVFFVDLSAVRETEAVPAGIARAIGLSETSGQALLEELKGRLRQQQTLLVLDNFEQVTTAAPMAVELLEDCRGLKLLVTSREALRVRAEHLYPVPPLSLPRAVPDRRSAAELAGCEAVQLFVDRAQAVRADFRLTEENADAVADICRRLDGLPLAIELATARLNLFSPEALRDRLGSRLRLLRGGARDLPARQQTLRATIEWSYQLLEPGEQRLFELLSVFSGAGFEAVEVVAAELDWLTETQVDILDGLASLVDKSLLRQADAEAGEPRLVMLETIREYAAERLDDAPEFGAAARRAHAAYFADFAQRQWEHLTGRRRGLALAAMTADLDNLRLAWDHWEAAGDLDQLNKLVDSLWLLYDARGWYHDTVRLTTDLLEVLSSSPSTPDRVQQEVTLRTSLARALMASKGYTPEVEEVYARTLELFEGQQVPQLFPVLRNLASFYNFRGEFDKGSRMAEAILRLADQQQDASMLVDAHLLVGANLAFVDDLHAGLEHLDKAIAYFRSEPYPAGRYRLGNNPGVACLATSAFILWILGHPDRALQRADEAVAVATELEHPPSLAYALYHAGYLHLWRREAELVRDRADMLLRLVDDHDYPIWRALGTCLRGAADTAMGQVEEGLAKVRQGVDLYQGLKAPPVFWPMLRSLEAGAHAQAGRAADGLAMIDEALEIAGRGAGTTMLPELQLLKGDLLLAAPEGDGADPEPWFEQAFTIAQRLGARMSQLRAAVRLCRLRLDRDGATSGTQLRAVYGTFAEGFATADLTEARALLETVP
ncbi:MAG TPA: adenylate/guanylate cyclase domain-containing protein [Actinomycetes bacterium]|nr:adenylate/guanylate cyclase domain-containing protein [Actinomycetes bacterium]